VILKQNCADMKTKFLKYLSLVGLAILMSCRKDSTNNDCNNNRFYFYESGKIALKEIFNKGTISFYDTLSIDTINMILKQYESVHNTFNIIRSSFITVNVDSKSCSETDLLFSKIKKDARISNCDKFLVTGDSLDLGIYDIFLCKLKSDSLINHLTDLVIKTNTKIVRFSNLGGYYLIRADKNSKGDALDMSNEFYESGYFEYAEPDFVATIVLSKLRIINN
jgi:hypothetical protein